MRLLSLLQRACYDDVGALEQLCSRRASTHTQWLLSVLMRVCVKCVARFSSQALLKSCHRRRNRVFLRHGLGLLINKCDCNDFICHAKQHPSQVHVLGTKSKPRYQRSSPAATHRQRSARCVHERPVLHNVDIAVAAVHQPINQVNPRTLSYMSSLLQAILVYPPHSCLHASVDT